MYETAISPRGPWRRLWRAAYGLVALENNVHAWASRASFATPLFLARCASHGERIAVDRLPQVLGPCRIELGSDVRISGKIGISASSRGRPVLRIGSGVFIGSGCRFSIAERIEIGDYVAIGAFSYIADTPGHSHARMNVAVWNDPAPPHDVAPVVIEDNVHIGRSCIILNGVKIGAGAIVGAGSVVRSNVPANALVMGNPARVAGWRRAKEEDAISRRRRA